MQITPSAWAEQALAFRPFWYQKDMLDSPASRKASRTGRRIGMTDTLLVSALWSAYSRVPGFGRPSRILLVGPNEHTVTRMFELARSSIRANGELRPITSYERSLNGGYEIAVRGTERILILDDMSAIARSLEYDYRWFSHLYVDSVDMMTDRTIATLERAIERSWPSQSVWLAGAICHEHSLFYRACMHDPTFEKFCYSSRVGPNWDAAMEARMRTLYSHEGFRREFLTYFTKDHSKDDARYKNVT